jgi:hypothetical protein
MNGMKNAIQTALGQYALPDDEELVTLSDIVSDVE